MRAAALFYRRDHTYGCLKAGEIRADAKKHEMIRCSLLGNSFHPGSLAILLAQLMRQTGVLKKLPSVQDIVNFNDLTKVEPTESAQGGKAWAERLRLE